MFGILAKFFRFQAGKCVIKLSIVIGLLRALAQQ